jgi:hypothetical protein
MGSGQGAEEEEEEDVSTEDLLVARATSRTETDKGITFIAFTAPPKPKTLERLGTRPRPTDPPASDNVLEAFDVYSYGYFDPEELLVYANPIPGEELEV